MGLSPGRDHEPGPGDPRLKANPNPTLVGSANKTELPFVVGVLADFSGHAEKPALHSRQFVEVNRANFDLLRDKEFCGVESSWRGLKYLVESTDSENVKIRLLDVSKKELYRDLQRASDFDHSILFKKVHDDIFGTTDAEPFGILIGDYEFSNDRADLDLLEKISLVAEAIHAPFLSAAAPQLLGVNNFPELAEKKDFHSLFKGPEYTGWRAFRQSEAARYICLTAPRLLLSFESFPLWGNAAFGLGARIISAFAHWAWCAKIRGHDGGNVTGLPKWTFATHSTSAEVVLDLWQQKALADSGFVPFGHHHGPSDGFAFVGTCHQPATYESAESTRAARLASDIRYVLSISRFVHRLRAMIRDQPPASISEAALKEKLNDWIGQYVPADGNLSAAQPLSAAHIDVSAPAGSSGFATVSVRASPGFQLEVLPYSLRAIFRLRSIVSVRN